MAPTQESTNVSFRWSTRSTGLFGILATWTITLRPSLYFDGWGDPHQQSRADHIVLSWLKQSVPLKRFVCSLRRHRSRRRAHFAGKPPCIKQTCIASLSKSFLVNCIERPYAICVSTLYCKWVHWWKTGLIECQLNTWQWSLEIGDARNSQLNRIVWDGWLQRTWIFNLAFEKEQYINY